jgi:hypothetical protein
VKATKEQIKMHVIAKSDCMTDGRYIPDRFIDAYHNASQPPTDHLPAITNHYVYVRLKPDAPPTSRRASGMCLTLSSDG